MTTARRIYSADVYSALVKSGRAAFNAASQNFEPDTTLWQKLGFAPVHVAGLVEDTLNITRQQDSTSMFANESGGVAGSEGEEMHWRIDIRPHKSKSPFKCIVERPGFQRGDYVAVGGFTKVIKNKDIPPYMNGQLIARVAEVIIPTNTRMFLLTKGNQPLIAATVTGLNSQAHGLSKVYASLPRTSQQVAFLMPTDVAERMRIGDTFLAATERGIDNDFGISIGLEAGNIHVLQPPFTERALSCF